jgi:hypothetical protein
MTMSKKLLMSVAVISILFTGNLLACKNNTCDSKFHKSIETNIVKAVSQTGLSAAQTKKIADGIVEYRVTMSKIRDMKIFPIDSFMNDEFNEKRFIQEMNEKHVAKIAAKAALFKYVFAVLNKEQRQIFKNSYAAPVIEKMIKLNY